ncbi:hypothetical protein [Paenibacillus sp. BAC0078]
MYGHQKCMGNITLFHWRVEKDVLYLNLKGNLIFDETTDNEEITMEKYEDETKERFIIGKGLDVVGKEVEVISFFNPLMQGINSQMFGLETKDVDNNSQIQKINEWQQKSCL